MNSYFRQCLLGGVALKLLIFGVFGVAVLSSRVLAKSYTPSDVFVEIHYANQLARELLAQQGVKAQALPKSFETQAKPMHVYELHISVLNEIYKYSLNHSFRPTPQVTASPIKYTPEDVLYLSRLVVAKLKDINSKKIDVSQASRKEFSNQSPTQVFQEIFVLYYRLLMLNGKNEVSPSEVYAQTIRAKDDLKNILNTVLQRLDVTTQERQKRLLSTATYGTHPDGSQMPLEPNDKTPADVLQKTFEIRDLLNQLRVSNQLKKIPIPNINGYNKISPIDIFLQTQFIIAELNLLKLALNIQTTTNRAKSFTNKTPSNVFYQMQHVKYMLNRLLNTQNN